LTSAYFEGNAPTNDVGLFYDDNDLTVYYLQGTTDWSSPFEGVPAVELPAIMLTANPISGPVPLRVNFTSASVDGAGHAISNWNWTFGDGSASAAQDPSHTYPNAGAFSIVLVETNNSGGLLAGTSTSITASIPTVAFTANPTNGYDPLLVSFSAGGIDSGGNTISQWNWAFGDGSTSTAQNPSHTYTTNGAFSLALVATNKLGGMVIGTGPASVTAKPAPVYLGLVLEGGFATGDFTGWTLTGDTSYTFVDNGSQSRIPPYSGSYEAVLGTSGARGYISQSLSTTAGATYFLSFWFDNPFGDPGEFLVSWNGKPLLDTTNPVSESWTNMQFEVSATGASTVLQFGFQDDYDWFGLDDISVVSARPFLAGVRLSGRNLVLNGTNGLSGGTYYVMMSTNLALPLSRWTPVATNVLSASGNFTITATNTVTPGARQQFYLLQLQ
jgi:PKD repeat protein